ncbi:kinesin motor catalytic domain protein (macronuclear) [Tetrahymena thermophila SB210]|uniref:Kinesin motor catalytic domain protein n=1 Tax=Tetrahymena thermophila (strain SB210) TaxID=312017 RepID=Q22KB8_TETTS|nr:kinesin motor catalytic domain protein [Tetrahymena thermophila SB210]EAR85881.2 kinesin motor catalytic domain protein [Tetrahymena thermophila SB210]|eukprot:XP_001033544.2 kinesin motor catalytic domain protein [Tetrahymena thermophila SB210]
MSQLTQQNMQLPKSPPQSSQTPSLKINGSQALSQPSQVGTPVSQIFKNKSIQNLEKVEGANNTPQNSQQNQTQSSTNQAQKEEKQQTQIQKMMQIYKGQNYKIGETSPICILKVRPLFIHETLKYNKQMIEVLDKEALAFHSTSAQEDFYKDFVLNLTKDKIYRAHRMIPQDQPNIALYGSEFPQIIDNLLKGVSHALLAFGAQDSGKTHSIFGTLSDPGLLLYFAQSLFSKKSQSSSMISIYLSVMKYENDFTDLLCPSGESLLFKLGKQASYMPCITRVKIESLVEFFAYLRIALRSMQSRDINRDYQIGQPQQQKTERNHCIFRFQIFHKIFEKQYVKSQTQNSQTNIKDQNQKSHETFDKVEQKIYESEMLFIDCDHYDINDKIDVKNIQQSMITLENIFQYIYEINKGIRSTQTHIPFDNTKFTNYLKSYLFGNNQLVFFGALSPFINDLDESMKTARMAQWAFYSKNSIQPKVTVGISQWQRVNFQDTIFLRKISHQTNVLGDEVKGYISNQYMKSDDKAVYLQNILSIVKDLKHLIARNAKIVRNYLSLREDYHQSKQDYMKLEFNQAKHIIRTTEIRELYLIRALPQLKGDHLKNLKQLQAKIAKSTSEINYYFLTFGQIKQKLKDVVEAQYEAYQNILKGSHLDALHQLGIGAIEYVKWSQENAIRSYEAHEAYRLDMWMDEITTKVFTFLEHLISQMDIKEVYQKKRVRTYKKIPTQIALRSLKSMANIPQGDIHIPNLNKIIQEEEKKVQGFENFDSEKLKNEEMPSLAQKRNHSFQFQRSPISGKYSPQVSNPKFLTPINLEKNRTQKSSVLDAFHTYLNLNENNSNSSTPNASDRSQLEFQSNTNNKQSIVHLSINQKSSFFSNNNPTNLTSMVIQPQQLKSTFHYFDENNSSDQLGQEVDANVSLDQKNQNSNKIVIIEENEDKLNKKKSILIKKSSIEMTSGLSQNNVQSKKKVNVTSFDLISSEQKIQTIPNQSNNSKTQTDKEMTSENEHTLTDDSYLPLSRNSIVKYSMDDLQRIDQQLKDKKAKLKEENIIMQKIAQEDLLKSKEQANQTQALHNFQKRDSLNNQTNSQIFKRGQVNKRLSDQSNTIQKFNTTFINRDQTTQNLSLPESKRDSQSTNINVPRENSYQQINVKEIRTPRSVAQQQGGNLLYQAKDISSFQQAYSKSLQKSITNLQNQYSQANKNLVNSQSQEKFDFVNQQQRNLNNKNILLMSPNLNIYQEDRLNTIKGQKGEQINTGHQLNIFNMNQNIPKNGIYENQYYLQSAQVKKKIPFVQMDISKNQIKLKSKIQLDEHSKFNSSFDQNEIKQALENSKSNFKIISPNQSLINLNKKKINSQSLNAHNLAFQNLQDNKDIGSFGVNNSIKVSMNSVETDQNQQNSPLIYRQNKLSLQGLFGNQNRLISPQSMQGNVRPINSQQTDFDLSNNPSKMYFSQPFYFNHNTENDQSISNIEQKVRLPSLHVQGSNTQQQQQTNNDKSSVQLGSHNQLRSESEKKLKGPKLSLLTPQLAHVSTQKTPIDLNTISYLKKKNRQQQENLKQILLFNINHK